MATCARGRRRLHYWRGLAAADGRECSTLSPTYLTIVLAPPWVIHHYAGQTWQNYVGQTWQKRQLKSKANCDSLGAWASCFWPSQWSSQCSARALANPKSLIGSATCLSKSKSGLTNTPRGKCNWATRSRPPRRRTTPCCCATKCATARPKAASCPTRCAMRQRSIPKTAHWALAAT